MNEEEKVFDTNDIMSCFKMSVDVNGIKRIEEYINKLEQENNQLKKQLEYLRSGEYLNQLKFERNMLEDLVQGMEISKEDKEFIDMTHRNTELLEVIEEAREYIKDSCYYPELENYSNMTYHEVKQLLLILDKVKGE